MLDVFNIATPQGCNIQTFYGSGTTTDTSNAKTWVKPRGVSNIYMLLIGPGDAAIGAGGGSGAVTVWYGAAQNVPDILQVQVSGGGTGAGGTPTRIKYLSTSATFVTLLQANNGSGQAAGDASTGLSFSASGFYQSVSGQTSTGADPGASTTTFLSAGSISSTLTGNYGYSTPANGSGIFQMQPIIVGTGGSNNGIGGIGCGGGQTGSAIGGPGFALIASW